jgi:hypothetical protein
MILELVEPVQVAASVVSNPVEDTVPETEPRILYIK